MARYQTPRHNIFHVCGKWFRFISHYLVALLSRHWAWVWFSFIYDWSFCYFPLYVNHQLAPPDNLFIIVRHHLWFWSVRITLTGNMTSYPHLSGALLMHSWYHKVHWWDVKLHQNKHTIQVACSTGSNDQSHPWYRPQETDTTVGGSTPHVTDHLDTCSLKPLAIVELGISHVISAFLRQ